MESPELSNSRRQLDKVTYTPLVLPESADGGGALQTAAAVDQLGLVPGEAEAVAGQAVVASAPNAPVPVVTPATPVSPADRVATALTTMGQLAAATNASDRLAAASVLAQTPTEDLSAAVEKLRTTRNTALTAALADIAAIMHDFRLDLIAHMHQAATPTPTTLAATPEVAQPPGGDPGITAPPAAAEPDPAAEPPADQRDVTVQHPEMVRGTAQVASAQPLSPAEPPAAEPPGVQPAAVQPAAAQPSDDAHLLAALQSLIAAPVPLGQAHLGSLVHFVPPATSPAPVTHLPIGIPSLGHHPHTTPTSPLTPELTSALGYSDATFSLQGFAWAATHEADKLAAALARPGAVMPAAMRTDGPTFLTTGVPFLMKQVARVASFGGHLTQRNLQPIGLLHLESLVMTPLAVERGELLYSLPLAPKEKVTLSHKEWTLREEEYATFVQDYLQNYSERGVADSSDMAVATASETEHAKTLSMTRPVSPGGATIADPVDTTSTASTDVTTEQQSQQQSRRETRETTQKASALTVRDQKISFTVNTVTGTEDFTSRLYENDNPDKVLLIDYYRRMRRWRNELYRTGIRLTYDVVLPDPGRMLRDRWTQVAAIDDQLATGFDYTPPALPPMDTPSVDAMHALAVSLGTSLPPAPDVSREVEQTHTLVEVPVRDGAVPFTVTVPIDPAYQAKSLSVGGQLAFSADGACHVEAEWRGMSQVIPADGKLHLATFAGGIASVPEYTVDFIAHNNALGNVRVVVDLEPSASAWHQWYNTSVGALRQAAYTRYNEQRELLRQQRAALVRELDAPDTITLRRMEREQVMRLVLQWLFPDFVGAGNVYQDADATKPDTWQPAMEYGEYIKFVHQAIDWDNALVLLYPYFWDNPDNHPAKLYLDHPDATHREFLRAGAARVVLAIRPGYEEEVVSLLDKGELGKLAPGSRFLPVIGAVRASETGFVTALDHDLKPTTIGTASTADTRGTQIGEWYDWTPTSALDIDVTTRPVLAASPT